MDYRGIINEDIKKIYEVLGMGYMGDYEESLQTINSKNFQVDLIYSLYEGLRSKNITNLSIKYINVGFDDSTVDGSDFDNFFIDSSILFSFKYNNEAYKLSMLICGVDIKYTALPNKKIKILDTDDIKFSIFDSNGKKLRMKWVDESKEVYAAFINKVVNDLISR